MRHAAEVARQIKVVIPEYWHGDIDWHITNASYKPPEQQRDCFVLLSNFCNDVLENEYPLKTEWKRKMIEILIDKPLDDQCEPKFKEWWNSKYSGTPNTTTPEAWNAAIDAVMVVMEDNWIAMTNHPLDEGDWADLYSKDLSDKIKKLKDVKAVID